MFLNTLVWFLQLPAGPAGNSFMLTAEHVIQHVDGVVTPVQLMLKAAVKTVGMLYVTGVQDSSDYDSLSSLSSVYFLCVTSMQMQE